MRYLALGTVVVLCCLVHAAAPAADVLNGAAGVGASAAPGLSNAAQLQNRAGVNVRGGASANAGGGNGGVGVGVQGGLGVGGNTPVGPNFGSARLDANNAIRASLGRPAVRASGSVGAAADAHVRYGRRDAANDTDANSPQRAADSRFELRDPRYRAALQADLNLANRLAEIDRLRDIALANADTEMFLRADTLESQARLQHEHQIRQTVGVAPSTDAARFDAENYGEFNAGADNASVPDFGRPQRRVRQQLPPRNLEGEVQAGYDVDANSRYRGGLNRGRGAAPAGSSTFDQRSAADADGQVLVEETPPPGK